MYMDQGSFSLGTGAIGSLTITKAPPTMATSYLGVTPAAVVDTPEESFPIMNQQLINPPKCLCACLSDIMNYYEIN